MENRLGDMDELQGESTEPQEMDSDIEALWERLQRLEDEVDRLRNKRSRRE
jgi:hypothetical protein